MSIVFQQTSEGELTSVQLVDGVLGVSDFLDSLLPQHRHVVSLLLRGDQCLKTPDFTFDPVGDVLDRVDLVFDHLLHLAFQLFASGPREQTNMGQ